MKKTILALMAGSLLVGCGSLPRDYVDPTANIPKELKKIEVPLDPSLSKFENPINEVSQTPIVANSFNLTQLEVSEELPNFKINNLNLSNASISDALSLINTIQPVSFTIDRTLDGLQAQGNTFSADQLSGSFADILERLSTSMGFFYTYRNNSLHIQPEMQFILNLPPVNSLMESSVATLNTLGARNVNLSKGANMISFTATRPVFKLVNNYLDYIKNTRSVIAYDTWIYEVALNDTKELGIQWNKFSYGTGANVASLSGPSGMQSSSPLGLSLIFSAGKFSLDALVQFLQTQGNLKTVSQPKLAVLNGEKGTIKAGRKITYISQITQTQGTAATPSTSSATTATLQLGTDLTLTPNIDDGTIYSTIELKVDDLNQLTMSNVFGSQIALPDTITREILTTIRSRPGDTILLGGVSTTREINNKDGIPAGSTAITNHSNVTSQKSELVIILKPQIIKFKGL